MLTSWSAPGDARIRHAADSSGLAQKRTVTPQLTVLFEDNHCLAVAKPAPLLTQAAPDVPSLEALVKCYIKDRYKKPGNVYLGIPHRLDRPVSGVVVFAHNTKAARRLAEQFQQRQVRKVYWAVVEFNAQGEPPPLEGVWEDWLLKIQDEARTERVAADAPKARRGAAALSAIIGLGGRRLAGNRAGNGANAPDSRASGDARLAGARRLSLWSEAAVWRAGGVVARTHYCIARSQPDVLAPHPLRIDDGDCCPAGDLAGMDGRFSSVSVWRAGGVSPLIPHPVADSIKNQGAYAPCSPNRDRLFWHGLPTVPALLLQQLLHLILQVVDLDIAAHDLAVLAD